VTSWNPRLHNAKRDRRRRYRLENETVDEKNISSYNRESRRRQRQSGAAETELQDLQLGVVM